MKSNWKYKKGWICKWRREATADKKYEDILKYCLNDYHNKPVYHDKIFSYGKDKIEDKICLGIKMNGIR